MGVKRISSRELYISLIFFVIPPTLNFFSFQGVQIVSASLFIIAFVYHLKFKKFRQTAVSYPLLIWVTLSIYHLLNAFYHHVPEVTALNIAYTFKIYACIAIFSYWAYKDLKETTIIFLWSFLVRCAVGIVLTLAFEGFVGGRMTGFGGTSPLVGQAAAITGCFIVYYNALNKCSITTNVVLYILPTAVVFLTQSRNSMLMLLITILATVILYANKSHKLFSLKSLSAVAILLWGLYLSFSYFQSSDFGQRVEYATEKGLTSSDYMYYSTGTIFDSIVGDRLIYYVLGVQLFLTNPLTGIGMRNYMYVTKGDFPLHSEYMIHLCEGGVIGFAIWLLFVGFVIKTVIKDIPNKRIKLAAISSLAVLYFCGIYAREFYYEWFYPIYGLALAPYLENKFKSNVSTHFAK